VTDPSFDHLRRQCSRKRDRRAEIHVNHLVDLFDRELSEEAGRREGGICDQHVDVACLADQALEILTIGQIADDGAP